MAYSYLDYFKRHIHLRDEHIFWLMTTIINEGISTQITPELDGLFAWWKSSWHTFGPGCVELPLDDFLRDPKSVRRLTEILTSIESKLVSFGPVVHEEEMNIHNPSSRFHFEDQSTASLCAIVSKFRGLLEFGQSDLSVIAPPNQA